MTLVIAFAIIGSWTTTQPQRPTSDRRRRPTRAGIVRSAATLVRERGVHGVGMREIVAHSGTSRGSLGRYFPGGKTQLVTEALDLAVAELSQATRRGARQRRNTPEAIAVGVGPLARPARGARLRSRLPHSPQPLSTPPPATTSSAPTSASCSPAGRPRSPTSTSEFVALRSTAGDQATVLLAAIEGALVLARARRTTQPLDAVEQHFKGAAPRNQRRC